jgi:hypothetical protein
MALARFLKPAKVLLGEWDNNFGLHQAWIAPLQSDTAQSPDVPRRQWYLVTKGQIRCGQRVSLTG